MSAVIVDPTADAPATASGETAHATGSKLQRLIGRALVLLCLGSPVASAVYFWTKPKPEKAADDPKLVVAIPADMTPVDVIDVLIRAGSYSDALTEYRKAAAKAPEAKRGGFHYREGVCLEALGRLKEAADAYKRAEPDSGGDRAAWARAVLGQARCAAARDDLPAARAHLDRVALRTGHSDCAGTRVLEECLYLRARIAGLELGTARALDPLDPLAVAWPALAAPFDKHFEWLTPDTPAGTSAGPVPPNVARVNRTLTGYEVTAHLAERPVADAVRAVAAAAGLKLVADAPTTAALAREVTLVDVEALPLDEVLAALLGRFGAGWKIEGDELKVALGTKPADRTGVAKLFRRALDAAPTHPSALAAHVWVANFEFEAGHLTLAGKEYRHVMETAPEARELPYAVYNLGLVELNSGARQAARSRFVDLVDRAPRSQWADYGWWWVGRTHMDAGDFTAARTAFQTALRGKTREVVSAAAFGTCAAELLAGNDDAARAVLHDYRTDTREAHSALNTAFDALLRYRSSPTESRRASLLAALRGAGDVSAIGPGGTLLAGRVYRDLGLADRTAALYDAASVATRGPLAARMTFEVAEWYDLLDRRNDARQRYLAVAVIDPKGYGPSAELKLAEMALRELKADECVRRCRALLARDGADKAAILAVMGKGYELARNHRAAAACFAGRVPTE